jgi:aminopeptidase N
VAAPNLTRDQAQQRAELLDVDSYRIELDLTDSGGKPGSETFRSTTTVAFRSRTPGASTWIDIVAATVHRAVLNGVELDVSGYREEDGLELTGLAEVNEITVEADCRYMNTGEGVHRFVDPVDGGVYLYSQFETADAKRMFACFDQPDLKSVYDLAVVAPSDWKVISNSAVESTVDAPGGADRHVFGTTKPMSTYLVALVAGPYAEWRDEFVTSPSRSASTAAPRWRRTWTSSGCSPRPSRASGSSTRPSASATRSASTTSASCRSSTRARWRTRAA